MNERFPRRHYRLHKKRNSKDARLGYARRKEILNGEELSTRLGVAPAQLQDRLTDLGIRFHLDSQGEVWASLHKETYKETDKETYSEETCSKET